MIANKHTELRLVSNLNDLLEDSKTKQEINKKIHKHTFEYMMTYVSDNDLENVDIYDKLEELSSSYQKHCYNIAKEIKDEILEENGEEIEVYETIKGVQVEKKEIFLNPKKFSQKFKDNLEEDLSSLVIDNFFQELDKVVKTVEYKKKIENLRKKDKKNIIENNKDNINYLINARIKKAFDFYVKKANGNKRLVVNNFSVVQEIIDDVFDDVLGSIREYVEEDSINKSDIESMFSKQLKMFIKEQKALLNEEEVPIQVVQSSNVKIPKSLIAYGVSKIWEDITK